MLSIRSFSSASFCFSLRHHHVKNCCRYDFPWTPTKYIPFYGGPDYHDYHHYVGGQSQSNFASVFTYCDYIYGTDKVIITNKLYLPLQEYSGFNLLHSYIALFLFLIFQGFRYQKKVLQQVHRYIFTFNMHKGLSDLLSL